MLALGIRKLQAPKSNGQAHWLSQRCTGLRRTEEEREEKRSEGEDQSESFLGNPGPIESRFRADACPTKATLREGGFTETPLSDSTANEVYNRTYNNLPTPG